jgi:hypothetical protein
VARVAEADPLTQFPGGTQTVAGAGSPGAITGATTICEPNVYSEGCSYAAG